jgi:hypothetical protein
VAAGSPSYSGNGAALVLQTTPPDQNLLDYLYIDASDIRMFDYRNSYVDVQQDVATVSTEGNIKEDAQVGTYSIKSLTYIATTTVAYEVDGGAGSRGARWPFNSLTRRRNSPRPQPCPSCALGTHLRMGERLRGDRRLRR